MKQLFSQLKNKINKIIQSLLKKPLFLEIITGSVFSIIIIVLTVSGTERETFREDFERTEEDNHITQEDDYDYSAGRWDNEDDWSSISRGDALSEMQQSVTQSVSISRRPTVTAAPIIFTPAPVITEAPAATPGYGEIINGETEDEIVEPPLVTIEPYITEEPEPEVILDPNGPVLVSDFEKSHTTNSFAESVTITGYNSSGDKLPKENITVNLNQEIVYPELSYNQSLSYYLKYIEGNNMLNIIVTDENNISKLYTYSIFYEKPTEPSVLISVDADSVGLGYMVPPTSIAIEEGKTVANYVKEILGMNGYSTYSSGSQNNNYTLKGLYRKGLYNKCLPNVSKELAMEILINNPADHVVINNYYTDFIRNGYFTKNSKWIFEINGELIFDSMSNYTLVEGDVLRVRYTLSDGVDLKWLETYYNPESENDISQ